MASHSPRSLTIVENDPTSIDAFHIQIKAEGTGDVVGDQTYPSDPSGTTVIPIGTNGILDNLSAGQNFQISVREQKDGVDADEQIAPGGPFTNVLLPDGAESIVVTI